MIEVRSYNGVANTWLNAAGDHHGVLAWLRTRLRVAGAALGAVALWMASFCPLYIVFDATLREFHQPLDPVSCLVIIGMVASLAYMPFYLTSSAERRWSITNGLLIGFGLVAGLVGVGGLL